jgi:hypothetical protein
MEKEARKQKRKRAAISLFYFGGQNCFGKSCAVTPSLSKDRVLFFNEEPTRTYFVVLKWLISRTGVAWSTAGRAIMAAHILLLVL